MSDISISIQDPTTGGEGTVSNPFKDVNATIYVDSLEYTSEDVEWTYYVIPEPNVTITLNYSINPDLVLVDNSIEMSVGDSGFFKVNENNAVIIERDLGVAISFNPGDVYIFRTQSEPYNYSYRFKLNNLIVGTQKNITLNLHSEPAGIHRVGVQLDSRTQDSVTYTGTVDLTISRSGRVLSGTITPQAQTPIITYRILTSSDIAYDEIRGEWFVDLSAECVHPSLYPEEIADNIQTYGRPWLVAAWEVNQVIGDHGGYYRNKLTTFRVYMSEFSQYGSFNNYLVHPILLTAYQICYDRRIYGGTVQNEYILPGGDAEERYPFTEETEYLLDNIHVPLSEHILIGPESEPYAELNIARWDRREVVQSDDLSIYNNLLPEEVKSVTLEGLNASSDTHILWYVPKAEPVYFNENQSAIIIFDAGGGKFDPLARNEMPSVVDSATDLEIGQFIYDGIKDIWVWCSGRSEDFRTGKTIKFKSLPVTPGYGGNQNDVPPSLIPPYGITGLDSWGTESPYFVGEEDTLAPANDRMSFEYILPAVPNGKIIRRVFYPHWIPEDNEENIMKAVLSTTGYGTIVINNITKVTETYTAKLTVLPIAPFGYGGTFCMDTGVSKKITLNYTRAGLPYPLNPRAPTPRECDDNNNDSRRWSNGKWISEMKVLLNRWQMRDNGSELYLLRPGEGRLTETGDSDNYDPMRKFYTKIIGDNCYITSFPINYTNSMPQAISGSIELAIGTLYPKKKSPDMIEMKYYNPIYPSQQSLPGSAENPYNGYETTLSRDTYESMQSEFYVLNPTAGHDVPVNINGSYYQSGSTVYGYSAYFKDGETNKYGLEVVTERVIISIRVGLTIHNIEVE